MRVKTKDIDNSLPFSYRQEENAIAQQLVADIRSNGFNGRFPLVVMSRIDLLVTQGISTDKKYVLMTGFMRYLAAKEVDCDVVCELYRPRLTLLQKFHKVYLTLLYYVV